MAYTDAWCRLYAANNLSLRATCRGLARARRLLLGGWLKHFPFLYGATYTNYLSCLSLIPCCLLSSSPCSFILDNTYLVHNSIDETMNIYSSSVTIHVIHPIYGQPITLSRLRSSISDLLDCLGLPKELRKQQHLSFEGVWLGESVSIQEVSGINRRGLTIIDYCCYKD